MANSVNLTAAMRANLLSLQSTATLMGNTQFKLATGNKVNSALDSPTAFFAAQGLNNRAGDLSALLDGMGQAVQTLKAADNALTNITTLVNQAKSIAQAAKDTATAASGGSFLSGSMTAAQAADLTGSSKFAVGADFVLTASGGAGAQTFTVTAGMTLATLAALIDAKADFSASVVTSTLNGNTVSRLSVTAVNSTTATITFGEGVADAALPALQGTTVIGGTTGITSANLGIVDAGVATANTGAPTDATLVTQYDAIRTQIDQLVLDAGYRGTNLLNSNNLITQFNEANTASQTVTGVNMGTAGLLALTAGNFSSATTIDADLVKIETALTTLRTQAKSFGTSLSVITARQEFTTNLVNVLKDGASALTLADKNDEGANLLALQTSQQLGIQSLSLASQANQAVLRLFQ